MQSNTLQAVSRLRRVIAGSISFVFAAAFATSAGCGPSESSADHTGDSVGELVLYSSVDTDLLREIVRGYEQETGVRVRFVGDTEATKTTGLVQRILTERGRAGADVWWSSEPFGTIRLSLEDALEAYESPGSEAWPRPYRSPTGDWYAFARRHRVLVYRTDRVNESEFPGTLSDLTDEKWRGRIGIARPQFGTTRGHMAALLHAHGPEAFRAWTAALNANRVRVYDGNASVVRGLAQGEIDIGLTDTDDVYAGMMNGWPVGMVYIGSAISPDASASDEFTLERIEIPVRGDAQGRTVVAFVPSRTTPFPVGPMEVPSTVAKVRNAPNPEQARAFIDWVTRGGADRVLGSSFWRTIPNEQTLAEELDLPWEPVDPINLGAIQRRVAEALEIWDEEVGGR